MTDQTTEQTGIGAVLRAIVRVVRRENPQRRAAYQSIVPCAFCGEFHRKQIGCPNMDITRSAGDA